MINKNVMQAISIFVLAIIVTACTQDSILDIEDQAELSTIEVRGNGDPCGGYNSIPFAQVAYNADCTISIVNLCEDFSSAVTGPGFSWNCALGDCKNGYEIIVPSSGQYQWKVYTRTGILMDQKTLSVNSCDGNGDGNGDASNCVAPDVDITNIKRRRVTAEWSSVSGAIKYQVRFKESGTSGWTKKTTASTSRILNNLERDTNYEYQSRTKCNGEGWTSWSSSDTFRTR